MILPFIWVTTTTVVQALGAGTEWPPLRAAGLLGTENRKIQETSGQPPSVKKPLSPLAQSIEPAGSKLDKPVGEGSFDDFGFGPDAGDKPAAVAAGTGGAKVAEKPLANSGVKPQAGAAVRRPIGPVRLTARPEPLPRLMPVTVTATATAELEQKGMRGSRNVAQSLGSETGFVKGQRVK